jgi:hypothetical protein
VDRILDVSLPSIKGNTVSAQKWFVKHPWWEKQEDISMIREWVGLVQIGQAPPKLMEIILVISQAVKETP